MTPAAAHIAIVPPPGPGAGSAAALLGGLRERGWDARLVPAAAELRQLPKAAIVHFLGADHARSLVGAGAVDGTRTAVTFSAHDVSVAGLEVNDYYRGLWERADVLHFPDEAVLARALRRGCPSEKPRVVIPPFVDAGLFAPDGRRPPSGQAARALRVLCAGPLEWAGGYEHGLQALALARRRGLDWECRVAGEGEHLSALLFARHQLGLDDVAFEPAATAEALRTHMLWADVFLAPAVIDGLPEHVAEACAMELCVVMSDAGPLGELEPGESAATTVSRRDPDALADALAALAADPDRRARMGAAARRWALGRFALEEHLDGLDALYRYARAAPRRAVAVSRRPSTSGTRGS